MSGPATGQTAADVAWARPPFIPADMIMGYCGAALPDVATIKAWGKPFVLGFESATTRSYAGWDAGITDANYFLTRADIIGYPTSAAVWVCAADASSTDAFYVSNITQYFAAWRSVLGASRVIWAYGNPTAVEAAIAGGATIRWGVGTWGYGEGGGPYQMPTSSGADILQSGNTPGPADGTDYNALYAPLSTFAAWGGPSPTPPVVDSQEGSEMEVAVGPTFPSGHLAIVVDNAGDEVARWQSDGTAATETYGIPNQVTTVPKGTPVRIFSDVTLFGSWLKAHDAHQKLINTPQSAVTLTDAQLAKIAAAVKPAVYNVTLTGQSKPI